MISCNVFICQNIHSQRGVIRILVEDATDAVVLYLSDQVVPGDGYYKEGCLLASENATPYIWTRKQVGEESWWYQLYREVHCPSRR